MKKLISAVLSLLLLFSACSVFAGDVSGSHTLYYQGHASLRITTAEGKVIYVDPYSGDGYDVPADLILVTHRHDDHNAVHKIKNRNEGCQVITWKEGLFLFEDESYLVGAKDDLGEDPHVDIWIFQKPITMPLPSPTEVG